MSAEANQTLTDSSLAKHALTMRQMLAFFIPLGIAQSLVTISHVVINGTLARADHNPEIIIASYAIALSMVGITEKPAVLMRQTCSALVRDRISFNAMSAIAAYILLCTIVFGLIISYTPLGEWVFLYLFGADQTLLQPILDAYRVIMFVSLFSGIRCLYHGVIIFNMRTKWLTIGMVLRLLSMYLLSVYFISFNKVNSGQVGAIIFLVGMMVEAAFSYVQGNSLVKKLIPYKAPGHHIERKGQIFQFYRPLMFSSFIAVLIGPAINAMLGKTVQIELAIASYAIALSVAQLVQSFFSYMHQIALNFFNKNAPKVVRFVFLVGFIPSLLLGVLGYTPAGPWFLQTVMGTNDSLMIASLHTLRVFMIMTLFFPFLDFCNGILMLKGQTKVMVLSQAANITITVITLLICVALSPGWNGMIGALAQSLGVAAELLTVLYIFKLSAKLET